MANRIVKIEDICHVVKGETGIMKAVPGEYPMVVLSEERKTHNGYQFDCKAVIIPLVSSTGHGHASMKRIHYQEGKFALGSILCALVPKKEGEYDPEYLYHILDIGKERIFVPLMKGMANVSLPMNRIKSVEINLPPYDEQVRLSKIYSEVTTNLDLIKNQTDKQHKYLKQLRQTILQLAVQGKLTAKWREENPNIEPENFLLEKIKAEKEKLTKNGLVRKEKPLPKLKDAEKPFELPKNWVCERLGTYTINRDGSRIPLSKSERETRQGIYDYYGASGVIDKVDDFLYDGEYLLIGEDGANLVARSTPIAFIAKGKFWVNNHAHVLECLKFTSIEYVEIYINSMDLKPFVTGGFQPKLSQGNLNIIPISIPPFDEQLIIVNKVTQLMNLCDELEKKIEKRDSYQERIMQAVVKQAFTTKLETVETE